MTPTPPPPSRWNILVNIVGVPRELPSLFDSPDIDLSENIRLVTMCWLITSQYAFLSHPSLMPDFTPILTLRISALATVTWRQPTRHQSDWQSCLVNATVRYLFFRFDVIFEYRFSASARTGLMFTKTIIHLSAIVWRVFGATIVAGTWIHYRVYS